jgi:hypothetical protein
MEPDEQVGGAPAPAPGEAQGDPPAAPERAELKGHQPSLISVPGELLPAEVRTARKSAGLPVEGMHFRSCNTEVKANAKKRQVEFWMTGYGNVDDVADLALPGSGGQSVKDHGPQGEGLIKFFANHTLLLGPMVAVEEHTKGILAVGQVDAAPDLDRYLAHAESKALGHGSMGYIIRQASRQLVEGKSVRVLERFDILEGSIVAWPANRLCTVEQVKSFEAMPPELRQLKGLWDFAEGVNAISRIRSAQRFLDWVTGDGLPSTALTVEEAAEVRKLLDAMTNLSKSLTPLLPYAAESAALRQLIETGRKALGGNT